MSDTQIEDRRRRPFPASTYSGRLGFGLLPAACFAAALGCGDDKASAPRPKGAPGDTVAIDGQKVESGFAIGRRRTSIDVAAFRISKYPVTVGEYRTCVSRGSCQRPVDTSCISAIDRPVTQPANYSIEAAPDDSPATCVGLTRAREYCRSLGATLPTLEQWFLAARGTSVQRYAWGSGTATCNQHIRALLSETGEPCKEAELEKIRVAQRPAGASPFGMQDVLITSGELLDLSSEAAFAPCRKEEPGSPSGTDGTRAACVVYGIRAGAIDSVREMSVASNGSESGAMPYGFRCVWGGAP